MNNDNRATPSVPGGNVFDASKSPLGGQEKPTTPPPLDNATKQDILKKNGKKFSFNLKPLLIILGGLVVLLLAIVLVRGIIGSTQSKEVKITWWSLDEDTDAVKPLIDEYKQNNPNVTIDFVKQSPQDYKDRLASSIAKGQGPDIYEFHNSWVPMFMNELSPVNEDYSNVFYPTAVNALKTKNGYVGIPLEYDGIALFVNQDIFRSFGKSAPKTWDDLRAMAQQLTLRDPSGNVNQAGVALGVTSNVDYWQDIVALLLLQNGADLANPVDAASKSALTFFVNFASQDRVWDNTLPNSTTYFANGKLAMYFGTYRDVFKIKKLNPNLSFGVVPLPQLPGGNASVSYSNYWINGVWSKGKHTKEAWDFLKFMSSKSSLLELYKNEIKVRGYGNIYPRVDMQSELLSDPIAGSFVYQATFASSWYLNANTFDGANGINTQVAKYYGDAISAMGAQGNVDETLKALSSGIRQVLFSYGLASAPVPTK